MKMRNLSKKHSDLARARYDMKILVEAIKDARYRLLRIARNKSVRKSARKYATHSYITISDIYFNMEIH